MAHINLIIDYITLAVVVIIGSTLMFFGAMWFTGGMDLTIRYIFSSTVTFFIAKEIVQRLLKD